MKDKSVRDLTNIWAEKSFERLLSKTEMDHEKKELLFNSLQRLGIIEKPVVGCALVHRQKQLFFRKPR